MKTREPRWARFTRSAVGASSPEVVTVRARQGHRRLRTLFRSLAQARQRPGVPPARRRVDIRLVPAVVAAWAAAALAIALERQQLAGAVAFMCTCVLAGTGLTWVCRLARCRRDRGNGAAAPAISNKQRHREILPGAMATLLVAGVCVTAVLMAVGLRQLTSAASDLERTLARGEDVVLTVDVASVPRRLESGPAQLIFDAVVVSATAHGRIMTGRIPIRVVAAPSWAVVRPGDRVSTAGRIVPARAQDRVKGYLHPSTPPLSITPVRTGTQAIVVTMRTAWAASVTEVWKPFSGDAAALLPGMVMGDRSAMDASLSESMKTTGLTHLTAVSGANCTLVLASLMILVRSLRAPRALAFLTAGAGLVAFVVLVGPDPSVLRAAVMGALGAVAILGGRPERVGSLLSVSIVALLLTDPWLAVDYAFILSVLATLGIHLVGRRCVNCLAAWLPVWLAQAVAIPLAAQVLCAPVIVLLAPRLTPYTIPANMLAAPVVALVTTVGTLGLAVGALFPLLGSLCALVSGLGAWWVAALARWMAELPAASVPWPAGLEGVLLMAALNAVTLGALFVLVENARAQAVAERVLGLFPSRWRARYGFPTVVCLAAGATAWWCAAVLKL